MAIRPLIDPSVLSPRPIAIRAQPHFDVHGPGLIQSRLTPVAHGPCIVMLDSSSSVTVTSRATLLRSIYIVEYSPVFLRFVTAIDPPLSSTV